MNSNTDLDEWRELWQGEPGTGSVAAELRERVLRETRRQNLRLLASILVTVVIGGGVAARAIGSGDADDLMLAAEAWLFIAVTWAGTLWIDRGTWRPLGDSTSAFLDVAIGRCRSALKATFFIVVMYVLQLAVVLWVKGLNSGANPATVFTWPVVLLGWAGVSILVAASAFYVRRKRAELDRLITLRRDVVGS